MWSFGIIKTSAWSFVYKYLLGHQFTILTDHWSLKELMSQVVQTPEQQLYLTKLLGFDYRIYWAIIVTNHS